LIFITILLDFKIKQITSYLQASIVLCINVLAM